MSGFKPGDVVVCVDAGPFECSYFPLDSIERGKTYRIDGVAVLEGHPVVTLCAVVADTRSGAFGAYRFRHLPKADPAFTEAMRALRPEKEGVA